MTDRGLGASFNLGINREALKALDKEPLIRLVLAQAEMIAALTKQVDALTARVTEFEAKLRLPLETPDNSSQRPSKEQKPSAPAGRTPGSAQARIGRCTPIRLGGLKTGAFAALRPGRVSSGLEGPHRGLSRVLKLKGAIEVNGLRDFILRDRQR